MHHHDGIAKPAGTRSQIGDCGYVAIDRVCQKHNMFQNFRKSALWI